MSLIFPYLSNLSNLSNQKSKLVERSFSAALRAEDRRRLKAHYKICQKGRTRWPRWTDPITAGISRVHPRIGRLDGVRLRLDTMPSSPLASPQTRSKRRLAMNVDRPNKKVKIRDDAPEFEGSDCRVAKLDCGMDGADARQSREDRAAACRIETGCAIRSRIAANGAQAATS